MKPRIAMALSVVGVLSAGSAAALANSQILDSHPAESTASAAVLPPASVVDVEVPNIPEEVLAAAAAIKQASATATDAAAAAAEAAATEAATEAAKANEAAEAVTAAAESTASSTEYLTSFNVGNSGVVTVDVISGQLIVIDAKANSGWQLTKPQEHPDKNEVEVGFSSSTVRVTFKVAFIDGRFVPNVSSEAIGASAAPAAAAPAANAPSSEEHESEVEEHESESDEHESESDEPEDRDDD